MKFGLLLYRVATLTAAPLILIWFYRRARTGKETRARLNERYARALPARSQGDMIWLHGASIGESKLLLAIVRALHTRHPDLNFLMTSQTRSAADIVSQNLPPNTQHQMAPIDTPAAGKRFLDHWHPKLLILAESEIWPNLLRRAQSRGVRTALVNARMTPGSLKTWRRFPRSARKLFSELDFINATDLATAELLSDLTARPIPATKNLKIGAMLQADPFHDYAPAAQAEASSARTLLGASTHPGEEALLIEAFQASPKGARLILAPRHAERGSEVSALLNAAGLAHARRSAGGDFTADTTILLADSYGEMDRWYDHADIVYLGGGYEPGIGGHNPLEPLQAGKPVITGPHTTNFADLFEELISLGLVHTVTDVDSLIQSIDAHRRVDQAKLVFFIESGKAEFDATVDALSGLIERP
jgi:3-deoxy-D-manno-octulosonic-acid transferase